MKFEIIPTKAILYDKCENVEQLYDNFYYPLLVEYKELKEKTKLFHKNGVFSLEYDKETLRDMVLEYQEKIERLNNIIKEAREYIEERYNGEVLTHTFDKDNVGELLNILKEVIKSE